LSIFSTGHHSYTLQNTRLDEQPSGYAHSQQVFAGLRFRILRVLCGHQTVFVWMWNSQFTPLPVLSKPIDLKSRHFEETPLAHRAASVKKGPKQPFAAI